MLDFPDEPVPLLTMGDFQSRADSHSAARYRKQAKEIRAAADRMATSETKIALLKIATSYEQLADRHSNRHQ